MKAFDELLDDFGIRDFNPDLAIVNGDLALNDYGSLLLTNKQFDSIFRFLHKWNYQIDTIQKLFEIWAKDRKTRISLETSKVINSMADHVAIFGQCESLKEAESALSGTIFVMLNTLLQTPLVKNNGSKVKFNGFDIQQIIKASSNNFRHYDEWSNINEPYGRNAKTSVEILKSLLCIKPEINKKAITTNVCSDILYILSKYEINNLLSPIMLYIKEIWNLTPR